MIHAFCFLLSISSALAGSAWPTIAELEASLSLNRGAELPKLVTTREGNFHAYYVNAMARANGHYLVDIKLAR